MYAINNKSHQLRSSFIKPFYQSLLESHSYSNSYIKSIHGNKKATRLTNISELLISVIRVNKNYEGMRKVVENIRELIVFRSFPFVTDVGRKGPKAYQLQLH